MSFEIHQWLLGDFYGRNFCAVTLLYLSPMHYYVHLQHLLLVVVAYLGNEGFFGVRVASHHDSALAY